jgi:hypothetical protein
VKARIVVRGGYGLYYSTPVAYALFDTANSEPWADTSILAGPSNANATWSKPFPTLLPPSALPIFTPYSPTTALSIQTASLSFRPPLTQIYNLNTQFALAKDFLLEVGYMGARATHLFQGRQDSYSLFASPTDPIRGATTNTVANIPQRAVIQGFVPGGISEYGSYGASWYNGLDVTLSKRISRGLQFAVAYTWSKILDTDAIATGAPGTPPGNPLTPLRAYGLADYDRRNRVAINYLYSFPEKKEKSGINNLLINGWQLSGVTIIQSGNPLTPQVTNGNNYAGITSDFAEVAPGCNLATPGRVENKLTDYFNKACIVPYPLVNPSGATAFGDGPIAPVTGPGQFNFDASLLKRIRVPFPTEDANIQFRADFFNVFNHPQFSNPATSISSPPTATTPASFGSFGDITSTSVNPRVIQFSLKYVF